METKFNFKSQICTDRNQSERLLALGLKKETADMVWLDHALTEDYDDWRSEPIYKDWEGWQKDGIPAWSLHRLVSLTNTDDIKIACNEKSCWGGKVLKIAQRKAFIKDNLYDNIIDCIEWLIKEGYFNKEYLEE